MSGVEHVAQQTAWLVSQRYECHICYLADDGPATLATCTIGRILYALKQDVLDDTIPLPEALVQVLGQVDMKQALAGLRNTPLPTHGDTWTEAGIFQRAGIYDITTGKYYHNANPSTPFLSKPNKYGYRLGIEEDAQHLCGATLITRSQPVAHAPLLLNMQRSLATIPSAAAQPSSSNDETLAQLQQEVAALRQAQVRKKDRCVIM